MDIHDYTTMGGKNLIKEYINKRPMEERREGYRMPFEKVDPIAEAIELQEMFRDDPEAKKIFRQYEIDNREAKKIEEELELRNRLVEMRKIKNITQKDLEARTGMTQQAISRFETGSGVSFKTILKYAEGIDCKLIPQSK